MALVSHLTHALVQVKHVRAVWTKVHVEHATVVHYFAAHFRKTKSSSVRIQKLNSLYWEPLTILLSSIKLSRSVWLIGLMTLAAPFTGIGYTELYDDDNRSRSHRLAVPDVRCDAILCRVPTNDFAVKFIRRFRAPQSPDFGRRSFALLPSNTFCCSWLSFTLCVNFHSESLSLGDALLLLNSRRLSLSERIFLSVSRLASPQMAANNYFGFTHGGTQYA